MTETIKSKYNRKSDKNPNGSGIELAPGRTLHMMADDIQHPIKLAPQDIPAPDLLHQLFFGRAQA
jgi:hypothetical protein